MTVKNMVGLEISPQLPLYQRIIMTTYLIRNVTRYNPEGTRRVKVVNRFTHNKVDYCVIKDNDRWASEFKVIKADELIFVPVRKADCWKAKDGRIKYIAAIVDDFVVLKDSATTSDEYATIMTREQFLTMYEPNF
jgi:hypothetical protein